MSQERHRRLLDAFAGLCDLAPDRRADRLEEIDDDPAFRRELISLLAHHDRPIAALANEVPGMGARLLAEGIHAAEEIRDVDDEPVGTPTLPPFIGRYRIIRVVGEGGMGIVYEAEQEEPRRRVALKVVRPGLVSPALSRRFRRESQVLGRLRHPGIARILEAGVTDRAEGARQYFAMELIDGTPLLEFCSAHAPGTRQRLELVADICDALQHAHDNGVIHRDLKPANILVELHHRTPAARRTTTTIREGLAAQPKILDFGVARATDGDLQAITLRTEVGQLVGTLPYMSPEQVAGDASLLDVRSDVYSVGVIMYELLAGRLPYDLGRGMIPELARIIREQEPSRLGSLDGRYRGDIEAIVGKALEKDRARRFASAADLAADIRRHLEDQPITARPPSAAYRLGKYVKRRRSLVASSAIGLAGAAMLIAGALASVQSGSADRAASMKSAPTVDPPGASANVVRTRSADDWSAAHPNAEAHAFDEFYPGTRRSAPLAGRDGPVTLELADGSVTLSSFDAQGGSRPAIADLSSRRKVSDAVIPPGGTLVMEFDPPITAFYGMFGSLELGTTVTANLSAGGAPIGFATSDRSVHVAEAQGYGFAAATPFDRLEFTTSDDGTVLLGGYVWLFAGEGLGAVTIDGYGGLRGDEVDLDFACVFDRDRAAAE